MCKTIILFFWFFDLSSQYFYIFQNMESFYLVLELMQCSTKIEPSFFVRLETWVHSLTNFWEPKSVDKMEQSCWEIEDPCCHAWMGSIVKFFYFFIFQIFFCQIYIFNIFDCLLIFDFWFLLALYCTFLSKLDFEKNITRIVTVRSFDGAKKLDIEDKKVQTRIYRFNFLLGGLCAKLSFYFFDFLISVLSIFIFFKIWNLSI